MTAVVGILNKHAVAIAADSAVTIGNGEGSKIFNKANKVFTLSKQHPVGIMIYNSASFMGVPWETIIKVYRKQLGETCFDTIDEYQRDFVAFLGTRGFFSNPQDQLDTLNSFIENVLNHASKSATGERPELQDQSSAENRERLLGEVERNLEQIIEIWEPISANRCVQYVSYSFDDYITYSQQIFTQIQDNLQSKQYEVSADFINKLKRASFLILVSKENNTLFTGLIFTGFGNNEIFPQLIALNVFFAVDNKLRYYVDEQKGGEITNKSSGAVCPFAQQDVIDTILSGVDPSLENIFLNNFSAFLKKYNNELLQNIGNENQILKAQIEGLNIDEIIKTLDEENLKIKRERHILPLINAVSNLSKDDLAEMAESLIYLTYLKRRITFAEESVGGPVDVAVISKGDGFIWIKRKHYFRPELNQHFFDNYFK